MHASLTVEENLLFSARYRLPASMTHAEHLLSVERTIQVWHHLTVISLDPSTFPTQNPACLRSTER